jgi:hypothetical protein
MRTITRLFARSRIVLALALIAAVVIPLARSDGDDRVAAPSTSAASIDLTSLYREGRPVGFNDGAYINGGDGGPYDIGVTPADTIAWARAAGATSHRIFADWRAIEPRRGVIRGELIERMRQLAAGFEGSGGRLLVALGLAPPWARDPVRICGGCHGPPAENPFVMDAWDDFVRLMARTFPDAAFEVWNEPNFTRFWSPAPDPARYARLVRRTARVVRETAPMAKVLAGSVLAVDRDVPDQGIVRSSTFLEQAFAAGLRGSYDAISWHVYPAQSGGRVEDLGEDSIFRRAIADVQGAIDDGDPGAAQWVTETGVTTTGEDLAVPADAQRDGLAAVLRLLASDERIEGIFIHKLFDAVNEPPGSRERGFGMVVPGGDGSAQPKPAFCMLRQGAPNPAPVPAAGCPPYVRRGERAEIDRVLAQRRRARARRRRAEARRRAAARRGAEARQQRERESQAR